MTQERVGHGGAGTRYAHYGCRCADCKAANTARKRRWRGWARLSPHDPRHGTITAYQNWGCRCDPCKAAGVVMNQRNRARRAARRTSS